MKVVLSIGGSDSSGGSGKDPIAHKIGGKICQLIED